MRVWLVGMEQLDQDGMGAAPEAAFSTREAAIAWGEERARPLLGNRYWWGTVSNAAQCYEVWELELDAEPVITEEKGA